MILGNEFNSLLEQVSCRHRRWGSASAFRPLRLPLSQYIFADCNFILHMSLHLFYVLYPTGSVYAKVVDRSQVKETAAGWEVENWHLRLQVDRSGLICSLYHKEARREVVPAGGAMNRFVLFDDVPFYCTLPNTYRDYKSPRTWVML